jgi:hypothetical protein
MSGTDHRPPPRRPGSGHLLMLVELAVADLGVLQDDGDRVVELPPMLSGPPGSRAARGHAEEPLAVARRGSG